MMIQTVSVTLLGLVAIMCIALVICILKLSKFLAVCVQDLNKTLALELEAISRLKAQQGVLLMQQQLLFSAFCSQTDGSLDVSSTDWVIKRDEVVKTYSPGFLKHVAAGEGIEIKYDHEEDGTYVATTSQGGNPTHKVVFSKNGSPISGVEMDKKGKIIAEYTYDSLGQVKRKNRSK